jgi:hypothetical protein
MGDLRITQSAVAWRFRAEQQSLSELTAGSEMRAAARSDKHNIGIRHLILSSGFGCGQ